MTARSHKKPGASCSPVGFEFADGEVQERSPLIAKKAAAGTNERQPGIITGIMFLPFGRIGAFAASSSGWSLFDVRKGRGASEEEINGLSERLGSLIDDCYAIPHHAHGQYRSYSPEHLIDHDGRAAAACTYCHMVAEAERRWIDRSGITFKEIGGMKVWIVGGDAVLRWKKMDEDGCSRHYPTEQAKAYDRGAAFNELPPPATRLTVGYLLNPTQTEITRIQIAKPQGKAVEWCVAINPPGALQRWEIIHRQFGTG